MVGGAQGDGGWWRAGRRRRRGRHGRRGAPVLAVLLAAAALAACSAPVPPPPVTDPGPSTGLAPLSASPGPDGAVVDAHGRQVQLRGVNMNHLGDYFQADPRLPTVEPLTDSDWAGVAALGSNVVRLVTSWSAWEPTRGVLDAGYLARVRRAVAAANAHGMYVVVDMHQDAWSKHVSTPPGEVCPAGTRPQIGWDGAPAWATITDGRPTCTPGSREDSPAVRAAWDAFYADRDGIRSALAATWGRISAAFAGQAGIAGFDLLNEPGDGSDDGARTLAGLADFYREALAAVRAAERTAGALPHLVFFETTVHGSWVPRFADDPDLVFAPHVYAESIGPSFPGLLDLTVAALRVLGAAYGTPVWVGEYGSFADRATNDDWMSRFARLHDASGIDGGTWWQWEQECGDPHDVSGAYPPSEAWVAAQVQRCGQGPWDVPCPARSYARAAPGRVTSTDADPCGGRLEVTGSTPAPSTADLWYRPAPGGPGGRPTVGGAGVGDVEVVAAPGGWRVFARVAGDYRITVAPPA